MAKKKRIFDTDRRVRLGIWGLGRGMSFYSVLKDLNVDCVAGCDYNQHMREGFLKANPGAFATADAEEFLAQDFDAVLLATFCPSHGPDAIRCLKAGKHVLSEVTAFHTMAEGVALVEAVEKSGRIYNLAENYPFCAGNEWLIRKWKEGLFGELMYAEYEYLHECRGLQYTYIDGKPVEPGHTLHNWRSWLNFHYYCTHSLGPIMIITGLRPVQVVSLPGAHSIAGTMKHGSPGGGVSPSLIRMSNGAVVRNLMGATTNDCGRQRIWGTLGAAEMDHHGQLTLRLGASGESPKHAVHATWDSLGELAAKSGHGGGDFWMIYYFVRQILTGEPAPFDIYTAADVTTPGILALRSASEGGKAYEVPDFRLKAQRDLWRNDHWMGERIDPKTFAFGPGADTAATADFSRTISQLVHFAPQVRAWADWRKVDLQQPEQLLPMAERLVPVFPQILDTYRRARTLAGAFPGTEGARVLEEMLDVGLEKEVLKKDFLPALKRAVAALRRRFQPRGSMLDAVRASALLPKPAGIAKAAKPGKAVRFPHEAEYSTHGGGMWFVCHVHGKTQDGLIYLRGTIPMARAGKGTLRFGVDGPAKVWVNGREVDCLPKAKNPVIPDQYTAAVTWKKGGNEVLVALDTMQGQSWGVCARGELQ